VGGNTATCQSARSSLLLGPSPRQRAHTRPHPSLASELRSTRSTSYCWRSPSRTLEAASYTSYCHFICPWNTRGGRLDKRAEHVGHCEPGIFSISVQLRPRAAPLREMQRSSVVILLWLSFVHSAAYLGCALITSSPVLAQSANSSAMSITDKQPVLDKSIFCSVRPKTSSISSKCLRVDCQWLDLLLLADTESPSGIAAVS